MKEIRTRVAPSPTGDPHVGTAYMALFNRCFAKKHGGKFILRIEDTDQVRSTRASEEAIMKSLRWLGLDWDEGPDTGGPHGPYRQSERAAIYKEHAQILLDKGKAFRCFCTPGRLDELRAIQRASGGQQGYDGHCKFLTEAEVQAKLDAGEPYVVRMDVPREGKCIVPDLLRGNIEIDYATVDMQVLMKSDGLPTYHMAVVVDDHLMGISHVIRGEEWIPSCPKHLLLYEYFGWEAPVHCHLPLLRNPDKSKLSKRKNPTSILWYQRMGYLPAALLNYLGMMAWSMPGGEELFSVAEMQEAITLERISLAGPVFDIDKLNWLNGRYLREQTDSASFASLVKEWALNPEYLGAIAELARPRISRLSDLGPLTAFFFSGGLDVSKEKLESSGIAADDLRKLYHQVLTRIDALKVWDKENVESALRAEAERREVKMGAFLKPIYIAISGSAQSVPLFDSMALLGRDLCRERLRGAIATLGGISSKEAEAWTKELGSL